MIILQISDRSFSTGGYMSEQRIIKFRVWDIKNKRMMIPYSIALQNTYQNTKQYHDVHYTNMDMSLDPKCSILLQYIGLKDKDGTEIYEGDIMKSWTDKIDVVEFAEGQFNLFRTEGANISAWEVIGSIYENPELLEIK